MTKRDRLMLLAVLVVVSLGGFWMLLVSPQRKAATEAQAQVSTARAELDAAQARLTAGQAAREAFQRDRTTIVKLGRVVPETDDIPTLLTQLESLAKKEKVTFSSYTMETSGAAAPSASADAATGTTPGAAGGTRSTDTFAPLYTPGSVEIAGGLARTPVQLKLRGKYFALERYLRAVQRFAVLSAKRSQTNGRLIIVDGFNYSATGDDANGAASSDSPSGDGAVAQGSPKLEATLTASVYYAPPLDTPAASAAGAITSPAAPPSGGSTTSSTGAATVGALR